MLITSVLTSGHLHEQSGVDTFLLHQVVAEHLQHALIRVNFITDIIITMRLVMQMSVSDYCHVSFALELIMRRAGIVYSPDGECSRVQTDSIVC